MTKTVTIGDKTVGAGQPTYVIAEIGLNHNGDITIAKQLIDVAVSAGCDAVKFQKRTPLICVPEDQRSVERDTPWGRMPDIDYRHRVEFGVEEYGEIAKHARERGIHWFASPWDTESVDFLEQFDVPAHKVASAGACGGLFSCDNATAAPSACRFCTRVVDDRKLPFWQCQPGISSCAIYLRVFMMVWKKLPLGALRRQKRGHHGQE